MLSSVTKCILKYMGDRELKNELLQVFNKNVSSLSHKFEGGGGEILS